MRVKEPRPSDRNPRTISTGRLENLKRSLQQDRDFLEARPLIVNSYPGRENIVIAGNMRLRAAQELGWVDVRVRVVSLPPEVEAQWNLKDNNQWGEYDDAALAELIHGLESSGIDVGLLGFTSNEVERLLALVGIGADADDEGFDPTPPAVPTSRPGDLYLLGPHRLIGGDARDATTWHRLFAAIDIETADAMWTDPPCGIDLQVDGLAAMDGTGQARDRRGV
jgi:ParB-like chromosome segregation protein Spo0J